MNFRQYLENLEKVKEVPPREFSKSFWVNDPNNPQQIDYWKKKNTYQVHKFPLAKDRFIHFSLKENIPSIVKAQEISGDYSIFAVSLAYGIWFPMVQFNHIISKSKDKILSPMYLANKKKKDQALAAGWKQAKLGDEIAAVSFQTHQMPRIANSEEVVWDGPLKIYNAEMMPSRAAIRLLKKTPYDIGTEDIVEYY